MIFPIFYLRRNVDLPSKSFGAMVEDRPLMNSTLAFFGGETSLETMIEIVGR